MTRPEVVHDTEPLRLLRKVGAAQQAVDEAMRAATSTAADQGAGEPAGGGMSSDWTPIMWGTETPHASVRDVGGGLVLSTRRHAAGRWAWFVRATDGWIYDTGWADDREAAEAAADASVPDFDPRDDTATEARRIEAERDEEDHPWSI